MTLINSSFKERAKSIGQSFKEFGKNVEAKNKGFESVSDKEKYDALYKKALEKAREKEFKRRAEEVAKRNASFRQQQYKRPTSTLDILSQPTSGDGFFLPKIAKKKDSYMKDLNKALGGY